MSLIKDFISIVKGILNRLYTKGNIFRLAKKLPLSIMTNSNPKTGLKVLTGLWPFLKPYQTYIYTAAVTLIFTAGLNLSLGQGVRLIVDKGFIGGSLEQLNEILLLFLVVVILMAAGIFLRFYLVTWIGERVTADLRKAVFNHLITMEPNYFETNRSGELMSRLTTDTTLLQSIIGSSISFTLRAFLLMIGGLVMLLLTNAKLTLVVFGALPIVILPVIIFGRRVRKLSRDSQDSVAEVGTYAGEIFQQIKMVQSYTQEQLERLTFSTEVETAFQIAKNRITNRGLLASLVILFAFTAIGIMIYVGARDVVNGGMSIGELAAFIFYAVLVAGGVSAVSEIFGELQRAAGAAERLLELLSLEPSIKTAEENLAMDFHSENHIRFRNVCFSYPSRPNILAIDHLTVNIKRGETVALVGSSGAGKSTFFELVQRFYDPQEGSILLNDVPLVRLDLKAARQQIALVPQHPTLFSSDILHNIAYGKPEATEAEIVNAAKAAHAHEFIEKLPNKYQSFLGERGVRLSGGQKQRIVIARAILNDPEILLLDEATSVLDAESECYVQEALGKLMERRTTIIIAHRLATIVHADRILQMEAGRFTAEGTHEELLIRSPVYQKLAALQFGHTDRLD